VDRAGNQIIPDNCRSKIRLRLARFASRRLQPIDTLETGIGDFESPPDRFRRASRAENRCSSREDLETRARTPQALAGSSLAEVLAEPV